MSRRHFGHLPGMPPGTLFASRAELAEAGVHRPRMAGISGSQDEGSDSVVLSGGYEDDTDWGDVILYTGEGGRDRATGQQVEHQRLSGRNLALAKSSLHGLPVRVVRGAGAESKHGPEDGYRYDGLYRVDDYWKEEGASGYVVWRYRLVALPGETVHDSIGQGVLAEPAADYAAAPRVATAVSRLVRDTPQARALKRRYAYRCQVCGERLETPAGPYAEAAHIRPLGRPHDGPDAVSNLLCLCPNHHVLFDHGAFTLADDLGLIGLPGALIVQSGHALDPSHVRYHRLHRFRGDVGRLGGED